MSKSITKDAIAFQLLLLLKHSPTIQSAEVATLLAQRFALSEDQLSLTNSSDNSNQWAAEVRTAYAYLKKMKLIKQTAQQLSLTKRGLKRLDQLYAPLQHAKNNH